MLAETPTTQTPTIYANGVNDDTPAVQAMVYAMPVMRASDSRIFEYPYVGLWDESNV